MSATGSASLDRYTRLHQALDTCPFHRDRAEMLAAYFAESSPRDSAWALFLMLGGQLPRAIPTARIQEWLLQEVHLPEWLVEESREQVGDAAETIALLAELLHPEGTSGEPSRLGLCEWIEGELLPLKERPLEEQRQAIVRWWRTLSLREASFLHHLLTARYQAPVPRRTVEEALAIAFGIKREAISQRLEDLDLDALRSQHVFLQLVGRAGQAQAPAAAIANASPQAELTFDFAAGPACPEREETEPVCRFEPIPDHREAAGTASAWIACRMPGGLRSQLIRWNGRASLWIEGEDGATECVSARFPELVQAASCLPDGTGLEGELHPASTARRRLAKPGRAARASAGHASRSEPVRFIALDLVEDSAKDIRTIPGKERLVRLSALMPSASLFLSTPQSCTFLDWDEAGSALKRLRSEGAQGFLLLEAAGPRRERLLAPQLTVDAVLLYVETGHAGLSSFNFALWDDETLVPLARVGAQEVLSGPGGLFGGLDDSQFEELEAWTRAHSRERFGPVRSVEPVQVFELGFDEIEASPRHRAGLTLRSPRILRWKKGAPAREASTLDSLKGRMIK